MSRLYQNPVGVEDEPDGRDNWWAEYSESNMSSATENGRIDLTDNLQYKWFKQAMETLGANHRSLDDYTRRLYDDLHGGHLLAGREMTVTRRQMNHIKTAAADFEGGRRRG